MPPSPPHAFRSRHAPWWALVAMCLVVLGPLIGQVSGQMHGQHAAHHKSGHAAHQMDGHAGHATNSQAGHAIRQPASSDQPDPAPTAQQGLVDACGYCSLYQHVPVLTLLLVLAALAGPIRRQGVCHRPARGHSRPAVFPQALTRAPPPALPDHPSQPSLLGLV
ncbi:DUF2946 family protein [Halomonas litopenaei]|uniref:DUF2946 family protein n=1 Tax=Halomonas litopenaei TaxID=2109328 RepID=UPI003F9ECF61